MIWGESRLDKGEALVCLAGDLHIAFSLEPLRAIRLLVNRLISELETTHVEQEVQEAQRHTELIKGSTLLCNTCESEHDPTQPCSRAGTTFTRRGAYEAAEGAFLVNEQIARIVVDCAAMLRNLECPSCHTVVVSDPVAAKRLLLHYFEDQSVHRIWGELETETEVLRTVAAHSQNGQVQP
jgi:hypothetical protein